MKEIPKPAQSQCLASCISHFFGVELSSWESTKTVAAMVMMMSMTASTSGPTQASQGRQKMAAFWLWVQNFIQLHSNHFVSTG